MTTIDEFQKMIPGIFDSETVIERIELIDMLSPPTRNATTMEKYLSSIGVEPTQESKLETKDSLYSADIFGRLFGINRGELFELLHGYDLSSLPEIPIRSLSIPLNSGVNGAWAPNGYGKTFAISNILQKLQVATGSTNTMRFENFIRSCNLNKFIQNYDKQLIINGWQSDGQGSWNAIGDTSKISRIQSKLIPFRELNFSLSCGGIISIRVDYGKDCNYEGFKIVVHLPDEKLENLDQQIEGVRIPVWLCLSSERDDSNHKYSVTSYEFDDDGEEIDYDDIELREKLLERILNLAIDYVEIPRLSYMPGFFEEISNEFKKYISNLFSGEFESKYGRLDDYPQLKLSDLLENLKPQSSRAIGLGKQDVLKVNVQSLYEIYLNILEVWNEMQIEGNIGVINIREIYSNIANASIISDYFNEFIYGENYREGSIPSIDTLDRMKSMSAEISIYKLKSAIRELQEGIQYAEKEDFELNAEHKRHYGPEHEIETNAYELSRHYYDAIQCITQIIKDSERQKGYRSISNKIHSLENRLNSNLKTPTTPWSIRVKLLNWMIEPNSNVFAFEYENGSETAEFRASWDTLSFGQKSNFILQTILILEEGINQVEPKYPLQRCLIIDEPEAGKAEAWVSQLIEDLQQHHFKLNGRKRSSVLILSHRGVILDSISDDGSYALMHAPSVQTEGED